MTFKVSSNPNHSIILPSLVTPSLFNRSHTKNHYFASDWLLVLMYEFIPVVSSVYVIFRCKQKLARKGPVDCTIVSFPTFVTSCLLRGVKSCHLHTCSEYIRMSRYSSPKEYEALVSFCDQDHVKIDNTLGGRQNIFTVRDLKQPDVCFLFLIASYLLEFTVPVVVHV